MNDFIVSQGVGKAHELFLKLGKAGFGDKVIQQIIESQSNALAQQMLALVNLGGLGKAADKQWSSFGRVTIPAQFSAQQVRALLEEGGYLPDRDRSCWKHTCSLLDTMPVLSFPEQVSVVVVQPVLLGFSVDVLVSEEAIIQAARWHGLSLCHPAVGPLLISKYGDRIKSRMKDSIWHIGMKPMCLYPRGDTRRVPEFYGGFSIGYDYTDKDRLQLGCHSSTTSGDNYGWPTKSYWVFAKA